MPTVEDTHAQPTWLRSLPACLGIWLLTTWPFLVHRLYAWDAIRPFDLAAALTLPAIAGIAIAHQHLSASSSFSDRALFRADFAFGLLFVATGLCMAVAPFGPQLNRELSLVFAIAGGMAYGWFYLR